MYRPLRCSLCQEKLEDAEFVKCPSMREHIFCFTCTRESIKQDAHCPSGEKCLGIVKPWIFTADEISIILGWEFEDFKKQRDDMGLSKDMHPVHDVQVAATSTANQLGTSHKTCQNSPESTTTTGSNVSSTATTAH